jgi:bifunctional oligoribonuclease and PAP phosphatase NrnA
MNSPLLEIAGALRAANKILILSHVRPDGDAIGSQLAMILTLRQLGKQVKAWNQDGLPDTMRFLPESQLVTKPPAEPETFDLVLALDTASRPRLGTPLQSIASASLWINLDHHASNPRFGDLVYIDISAPATGQIIFELIQVAQFPMNAEIAQALFAAISTDTGSFRYPNTRVRTFEVAAELVKAGVDVGAISQQLYDRLPKRRIDLLGKILPEARFEANNRVASLSLTMEAKTALAIQPDDIDGLIDYVRSVGTVEVALFFEELEEGKVRISMRSKDPKIDVNRICSEFGGGGHPLAAGVRMRGSLAEVRNTVIKRVIDEIGEPV